VKKARIVNNPFLAGNVTTSSPGSHLDDIRVIQTGQNLASRTKSAELQCLISIAVTLALVED
jgi:hypothetical protein